MPSPDRPSFSGSPPSPEAQDKVRRRILKDLQRVVEDLEPLYLVHDAIRHLQGTPLTKDRLQNAGSWLERLSRKEIALPSGTDEQDVLQRARLVQELSLALSALKQSKPLPLDVRKRYETPTPELAPDEVLLTPEDIPTWNELPSEADIKTTFKFDLIWVDNYKEGRQLKDFEVTDQDLLNVGYAVDDPEKRQNFLQSIELAHSSETLPPAKIFDISDIIREKEAEAAQFDGTDPDFLTTQELLEAFDEAGVRPATLKELLAYSKKYWKPKEDPNNPLTPEEVTQRANAPYIYAVGSVFSRSGGRRRVPYLSWRDGVRQLDARGFDDFGTLWDSGSRFLVFRKESS
jgi:hypothetical protein